jgi:hypothetical protein
MSIPFFFSWAKRRERKWRSKERAKEFLGPMHNVQSVVSSGVPWLCGWGMEKPESRWQVMLISLMGEICSSGLSFCSQVHACQWHKDQDPFLHSCWVRVGKT